MSTTNMDNTMDRSDTGGVLVITTSGRFIANAHSWACGSDDNVHLYQDENTYGDTVATIDGDRFVAAVKTGEMDGDFMPTDS
jgi:hypothetical protein